MTLARLFRISNQRLRSLWQKDRVDSELGRELAFHFDQLVAENVAEGMEPEKARQAARRALGNQGLLEEECRDQRRVAWLHDLKQDVLYALRMMRKNPGFTAIAAASLALGIGANTAILGVMDALTFGHLPFRDAERLVMIRTYAPESPSQYYNASLPDYFAFKDRSRSFESIGCSLPDQKDLRVVEDGSPPERIVGQGFAPGLFETLGAQPELGRVFTDSDYASGAPAFGVVISHRLWQRRFGGDPQVVGKQIRLTGVATGALATIIGVMPPDFNFAEDRVDYWVPLSVTRNALQASVRYYIVIARLKDGVTLEQAQADMNNIAAQLAQEFPDSHTGWGARAQPLRDAIYGWTTEPLLTLEAAVALVLLIACANVAGLLLARGSARKQEIAMRVSLGAGRGRIIRQMLTESLLLSLLGGLLGVLVAWVGLRSAVSVTPPPAAPRLAEIPLSFRMLVITGLTSVVSGLIFGIGPALATFNQNLTGTLKESVRNAGASLGRHRLRGALVASQIALAFLLLIGSGLFMQSFLRLAGRNLNFDPHRLLMFQVRIPTALRSVGSYQGFSYVELNADSTRRIARVFERLRSVPGAESVAGVSAPPVNSLVLPAIAVQVEGGVPVGNSTYFLVTPDFCATLRAQLVRGREISARDTAGAPWVAVINEAAARRFWPGEDPIGKRFTLDTVPDDRPREVVGVIRNIPTRMRQAEGPVIYASYLQQPPRYRQPWANMFAQMTFILRSAGDPMALVPEARKAVSEIEPELPLAAIATMDGYVEGRLPELAAYALVLGIFAGVATLLAAIGIYGVMAYSVSQQTHEIGIRMALGARLGDVLRLVGRQTMVLIGIGLVVGLAGSIAFTRLIASQLWGVKPSDPATFVSVSVLLGLVAILACAVPVRRAVRVDPTVALRTE